MQENLKFLLKYIVDSFWNELVKFEFLASIHSLKIKYEQVFSPSCLIFTTSFWIQSFLISQPCLQSLEICGAKGTGNVSDPRKRSDERALEKEEEDYFNEDRYV
jgi:protein phosphatase-4 regulatory subunit 3